MHEADGGHLDGLGWNAPGKSGYEGGQIRHGHCSNYRQPSLGDHVLKRVLFTPSTDPTPPAPTALLLFIQQAQMTLLYPERAEPKVDISPRTSDLSDAA